MLVNNQKKWENHGISDYFAKKWLKNGFNVDEAIQWYENGFSAESAKAFKKEGFTPFTAKNNILSELKKGYKDISSELTFPLFININFFDICFFSFKHFFIYNPLMKI